MFSAVIKNREDDEIHNIDEKSNALSGLTGVNPGQSSKKQ